MAIAVTTSEEFFAFVAKCAMRRIDWPRNLHYAHNAFLPLEWFFMAIYYAQLDCYSLVFNDNSRAKTTGLAVLVDLADMFAQTGEPQVITIAYEPPC